MDPMTLPLQLPTRVESQIKIRAPIKTPEDVNLEFVYRWWKFHKMSPGNKTFTPVELIKFVESSWPSLTKENRSYALVKARDMLHTHNGIFLDTLHKMLANGQVTPPYKSFDYPSSNAWIAMSHLWAENKEKRKMFREVDEDAFTDSDTDDEQIEDVDLTLAMAVANEQMNAVILKRKLRDTEKSEWKKARRLRNEWIAQRSGAGFVNEQD